MPQLAKLAPDATDATLEQLFARALHDETHRDARSAAAAACAAPARTMASLLQQQEEQIRSDGHLEVPVQLESMTLKESIHHAIVAATQDQAASLFIVDSAVYVAKQVRNALEAQRVDESTRDVILRRILLHQTREIHELLTVLHDAQHLPPSSKQPARVFVGPLCTFFVSFLTTNGLTTTGNGLLRMVQLACKRLQSESETRTRVALLCVDPSA